MSARGMAAMLLAAVLLVAGCGAAGPVDLLTTIKQNGVIRISTDPAYPPQSAQLPDGTFEGFDIDVANEIGRRLGVRVQFETPTFDLVQAGGWAGRWDASVGSITITVDRKAHLDFTQPYYFTPAQLAAVSDSGITTMDGFAGKVICVGAQTTYLFWLQGTLQLGDGSASAPVPTGATATTFDTDTQCADAIKAGRREFQGWLTASETLVAAIGEDAPFTPVGDPVFYEPLGVAVDKDGPTHAQLSAELDRIVAAMHADGTLTALSQKWYQGRDLSKKTTP